MGKKKILGILISIGLIGSFTWTYINRVNEKNTRGVETNRDTAVLVQKIGQSSYGDKIKYSGKLSYGEEQKIMSILDSKVVYVGVKEGDYVKKGDIILKFDSSDIDKNLEKVKSNYSEALNKGKESLKKLDGLKDNLKANEDELKKLKESKEKLESEIKELENSLNNLEEKKDEISIEEYEKLKEEKNKENIKKKSELLKVSAEIKTKEVEILALKKSVQGIDKIDLGALEGNGNNKVYEQIEKLKESYTIKAGIDGKITNLNAFLNEKIENKMLPAVTISNENVLEMKFGVDEEYLSNFKVGDKIEVQIEGEKETYKDIGVVKKIDRKSDLRTGQYNVYLEVKNNGNYKINDYVSFFLQNNSNVSNDMISKNCIIREGDKTFVYVVKDNIVNKKEVKTGEEGTHKIRIKEGLSTDDLVIEKGKEYIKEGQKVNIVEDEK